MKWQTVSGTTVLRGGVADVLQIAASAGLLADALPGEVLAAVSAPAAETAVASAVVEETKSKTRRSKAARYTRPNGEPFYERKITFGDRETTDVDLIRNGVAAGMAMYLVGKPGCGKTAVIEAALWDWEGAAGLYTLVGSSGTEEFHFVGGYKPNPDGKGGFIEVDGPLVLAMEGDGTRGGILYVDEIAQINPTVLPETLYAALDGRGWVDTPHRGRVYAKPGFRVIVSTNLDVPGAVMSDALVSRLRPPIEYTTDFSIAVKYLGVPTEVAALARDMTKKVQQGVAYWAPTMRDLLGWREDEKVYGARAAWQGLCTAAPVEARPDVEAAIESATGMRISGPWTI